MTIKETLKEPTYYQIVSFINILASQLKKFNKNYFLNTHQLILDKGLNQSSFRTFIVKNFIEVSKYFAEGAFTKIIKVKQIHNVKSIFGIYNEGEYINDAVNNLANNQYKISLLIILIFLYFFSMKVQAHYLV